METQHVTARLKAALDDISGFVEFIPEKEQEALLELLEGWKHAERRKCLRKNCSIPVEFSVEENAFTGFVENISSGGVFIRPSGRFFPYVAKQIMVSFCLPERQIPIKTTGKITWADPPGFGVKLDLPGKYLKEYLEKQVKSL